MLVGVLILYGIGATISMKLLRCLLPTRSYSFLPPGFMRLCMQHAGLGMNEMAIHAIVASRPCIPLSYPAFAG